MTQQTREQRNTRFVYTVEVTPGTTKTVRVRGNAFAIDSGWNPKVLVSTDEREPERAYVLDGASREFAVVDFTQLTFDFSALNPGLVYEAMRIIVINDRRVGTAAVRTQPFAGREFQHVTSHNDGSTTVAGSGLLTLYTPAKHAIQDDFTLGRHGFDHAAYLSGIVAADDNFRLELVTSAFGGEICAIRPGEPTGTGNYVAVLDAGWVFPFHPAAWSALEIRNSRLPWPAVGGFLLQLRNLTAGSIGVYSRIASVST